MAEVVPQSQSTTSAKPTDASKSKNPYPWWSPRFWHGMTLPVWFGMLRRNQWSVSPSRLPMAFAVSGLSGFNSAMRGLQQAIYGSKIEATEITQPPVFIIGHWRSGTTHLHEIMVRDPQFTYPTTYECFAPHHFLLTARWITKLKFLIPSQRPMDNMLAGWDRPQEDEFALLNLGAGSPYETIAFPNHRPVRHEFLELNGVSVEQLQNWKRSLLWFMKVVAFRNQQQQASGKAAADTGNRIILKSPPHTARVKVLRQLFPEARFIHIVRDPRMLFASNVRLWQSLWDVQGCQAPKFQQLSPAIPSVEEYVLSTFEQMYENFEEHTAQVPPEYFCEVRYEDLVANPLKEVERIYSHLGIEHYDLARPEIESYLSGLKDYTPNKHKLSPEVEAQLRSRWSKYFERYGY